MIVLRIELCFFHRIPYLVISNYTFSQFLDPKYFITLEPNITGVKITPFFSFAYHNLVLKMSCSKMRFVKNVLIQKQIKSKIQIFGVKIVTFL